MKNKFILIIALLLISNVKAKSQVEINPINKNIIYIEGAGIGGYGSLNYERVILKKTKLWFCTRIGLSTYNLNDYTNNFNPDIIIPIAINILYGNKHKFEFGIGQCISNIIQTNYSNWQTERKTNIHANLTIGYRYQNEKNGLIFRCSYTPIIEYYKTFRHWGGLSIGYAF